jgi:perosamine synthetase
VKKIRSIVKHLLNVSTPRRVALLGGTSTWSDCLVVLRYLAFPRSLVQGKTIVEYEQAFARQIGVHYAYSFASGRVGLYALLRVLGVGTGDEVLLQAPTHIVVANAVRYVGARPVYVDCQRDTYNMDLEQAERQITPKTKAIILQHTFGIPVDLDSALALAQQHGLVIIEDCVHALGATYNGRQVGSFGRAAFFSTEETKTISTTMGGMVVTDDPQLAAQVAAFQAACTWPSAWLTARYIMKFVLYHVMTEPRVHHYTRAAYEFLGKRQPLPGPTTGEEVRGGKPRNYERRLSNAQAVLGLRQLRRLSSNLAHRRAIVEAYRAKLSENNFEVARQSDKAEPAFVRYPVWVGGDRATAIRGVAPHAVLGTWFTSVLEEAISPTYGDYELGSCPQAEAAAKHLVNLPTHPRVCIEDVTAIVSAMASRPITILA